MDADQLQLTAMAKGWGCRIRIAYLDASPGDKVRRCLGCLWSDHTRTPVHAPMVCVWVCFPPVPTLLPCLLPVALPAGAHHRVPAGRRRGRAAAGRGAAVPARPLRHCVRAVVDSACSIMMRAADSATWSDRCVLNLRLKWKLLQRIKSSQPGLQARRQSLIVLTGSRAFLLRSSCVAAFKYISMSVSTCRAAGTAQLPQRMEAISTR